MKSLCMAVLCVCLSACASSPSQPAAVVRVQVPLLVPCKVPDLPEPHFATRDLLPQDSLPAKVRALLAERQQHLAYEARLRAALQACR
ncbi:MAG: hypothetical protein GAK44_00157 [Pseudomonas delhiensis]|nr:MAG: hypothetical protein GAK44_00157 [Pseudomonas delhiensis]